MPEVSCLWTSSNRLAARRPSFVRPVSPGRARRCKPSASRSSMCLVARSAPIDRVCEGGSPSWSDAADVSGHYSVLVELADDVKGRRSSNQPRPSADRWPPISRVRIALERRNQREHRGGNRTPSRASDRSATAPNLTWAWDITKLLGRGLQGRTSTSTSCSNSLQPRARSPPDGRSAERARSCAAPVVEHRWPAPCHKPRPRVQPIR